MLVLGSLWLTAMAAPAAAANQTRWVDDDAGGSGGPAACATAAYTSIQDAIDDSSGWDTVYVCPGTYPEQLTLDVTGILVQSRPNRGAHIVAPASMTDVDGTVSLVRMESWGARLIGFRLDIPAGDAAPAVSAANGCSPVDVAVLAVGERQRVNKNYIDSIGDDTFSGDCGYDYGIVFAQLVSAASFAPPYPAETSRASKNVVRDFRFGGILAEGNVKVRMDYNKIRFLHEDDPACGPYTPVLAPQDVCEPGVPTSAQVNGTFYDSFGIGAEFGALVDVQQNTVYGNWDPLTDYFGGPFVTAIQLNGVHGDSRVRGNTVRNFAGGILVGDLIVAAGSLRAGSTTSTGPTAGVEIKGNTVTDTYVGIGIAGDASHVHLNRSRLNILGMSVIDGQDNEIHDNDFSFNFGIDCEDYTTGSGTEGTANWWTDNLGISSDPPGLCTGAFPI